ncbi:MAG: hypothetical protein MUP17_09240 [candidate division Zixibacteria bacterium]|nr:hypothetical protein [candidate division Zixibacteria bacterium]
MAKVKMRVHKRKRKKKKGKRETEDVRCKTKRQKKMRYRGEVASPFSSPQKARSASPSNKFEGATLSQLMDFSSSKADVIIRLSLRWMITSSRRKVIASLQAKQSLYFECNGLLRRSNDLLAMTNSCRGNS